MQANIFQRWSEEFRNGLGSGSQGKRMGHVRKKDDNLVINFHCLPSLVMSLIVIKKKIALCNLV